MIMTIASKAAHDGIKILNHNINVHQKKKKIERIKNNKSRQKH